MDVRLDVVVFLGEEGNVVSVTVRLLDKFGENRLEKKFNAFLNIKSTKRLSVITQSRDH